VATSGVITNTLTASQMINLALEEIAVIPSGGTPEADEAETARLRLNMMLLSWQSNGVNLWREADATVTFTAGTATMTLAPRCLDVIDAAVVQSSTFERTIQRWETGEYRMIPNKAASGSPTAYTLTKGTTAITMTLWPVPAVDTDINYTYARGTEMVTDITETVDIPQEWAECIVYNLAARLANTFGAARTDATAVQRVTQYAAILEQQMLNQDRPASVFMEPINRRFY